MAAIGVGGRSSSSYSYYDIDTILAEEELIPAVTVFDMNHLAFLDPDGVHDRHRRHSITGATGGPAATGRGRNKKKKKRSGINDGDDGSDSDDDDDDDLKAGSAAYAAAAAAAEYAASSSILPEKSQIKLPLWTINQWVQMNFVRPSLPRHYGRKARERYDADPGDADLRYVLWIDFF